MHAWSVSVFANIDRMVDRILRRSGLSQAELARRVGLPRSVVNAYARGQREPGVGAVVRLALAAGFELSLRPRTPPVNAELAASRLEQVLDLAEALPFTPREGPAPLKFSKPADRGPRR